MNFYVPYLIGLLLPGISKATTFRDNFHAANKDCFPMIEAFPSPRVYTVPVGIQQTRCPPSSLINSRLRPSDNTVPPVTAAAQLSVRGSVLMEAVDHQTSKRPEKHKPGRVWSEPQQQEERTSGKQGCLGICD